LRRQLRALWNVRRLGHACTFSARARRSPRVARTTSFPRRALPSLGRSLAPPPGLARAPAPSLLPAMCAGPACRLAIACCMLCAWRKLACRCSCAGAGTCSCSHALLPPRRCCWPSCACVSARARCRWCALCVRARARSSGPRSVARTCWHAAWMRVPVPVSIGLCVSSLMGTFGPSQWPISVGAGD
jgi:hypothetical protein